MGMAKGGVKIHIKGDKTTKRNCNNSFMKVSTTREFANHQKYWQTIKDFVKGSQAPGQIGKEDRRGSAKALSHVIKYSEKENQ